VGETDRSLREFSLISTESLAAEVMGRDAGLFDRVELLFKEPEQFFGAGAFAHGCGPRFGDGVSPERTDE
jgi:hypothetical protein